MYVTLFPVGQGPGGTCLCQLVAFFFRGVFFLGSYPIPRAPMLLARSVVPAARMASALARFAGRLSGAVADGCSLPGVRQGSACGRPRAAFSCRAAGGGNGTGGDAARGPGDFPSLELPGPSGSAASPSRRQRILSGVQPTGALHLGNYLGAIRNWVPLQDSYETFFCVVDLHAITAPHDPATLGESSRTTAALYLACGIQPEKATIFVQARGGSDNDDREASERDRAVELVALILLLESSPFPALPTRAIFLECMPSYRLVSSHLKPISPRLPFPPSPHLINAPAPCLTYASLPPCSTAPPIPPPSLPCSSPPYPFPAVARARPQRAGVAAQLHHAHGVAGAHDPVQGEVAQAGRGGAAGAPDSSPHPHPHLTLILTSAPFLRGGDWRREGPPPPSYPFLYGSSCPRLSPATKREPGSAPSPSPPTHTRSCAFSLLFSSFR